MSNISKNTTKRNYRIPNELLGVVQHRAKINRLSETQYVIKALKSYIRKR